MKNVIVTGANGFIGSSLIKKLISKKVSVVALDISFKNSKLPESEFIKKFEIGLDNVDGILDEMPEKEYDAFYHFAWAGVNGKEKANPITQLKNTEMTMKCATICKALGVKSFCAQER